MRSLSCASCSQQCKCVVRLASMKPPRAHPRIQQLNLTLAEPSPTELPSAPKNELEAALAELILSVARACLSVFSSSISEYLNIRLLNSETRGRTDLSREHQRAAPPL